MKKVVLLIVVLALGALLTACGPKKNDLDIGHALQKDGKCAEAIPYFDTIIAEPDTIMDLAYAYFLKGRCAEADGDFASAYENYYAAKIVSCYAVNNDVHVNLNTYGRSEFCQKIIPEMLTKLAPKAGDTQALKDKVDLKLKERYLERFITE